MAQAKAKVGLGGLQLVGGLDQRSPQQQTEQGAGTGVGEGQDHHIARHQPGGAGHIGTAGEDQEDVDKTAEHQQRIDQRMGQVDRALGGDADVFGNPPVGVVVLTADQLQLVVVPLSHPAVEDLFRQPAPPVQLQPALDVHMQGRHRHGQQEDQHEGADLHQQGVQRLVFQGIEQRPAPVTHPDRQANLGQGEQQQQGGITAHPPLIRGVPVRRRQPQKLPGQASGRQQRW